MKQILIVEDDELLNKMLVYNLTVKNSMGIVSVETVADILRQKDESMQIVMTGSNLPEGLRPYVDTVISSLRICRK